MPTTRRKHESDPRLVRACLAGDQAAWGELVERYRRLVYSIPHRYGMDRSDADDVFQNVFRILLSKLDQLEDHSRLSSWLITTTHRECWKHGRRKPENVELEERDIRADQPPDQLMHEWEAQHLIREGLEKLGDPCKSLLEELFFQRVEVDYSRIAERLGMKIGSIGPTRARCLEKLRTILISLGMTESGFGD